MGRRRKHRHLSDEAEAANRASVVQIHKEKGTATVTQPVFSNVRPQCFHDGDKAAFTLWKDKYSFAGAAGAKVCLHKAPREDTKMVIDLAGLVRLTLPMPPKPFWPGPWFASGPEAFKAIEPPEPSPTPPAVPLSIPILKFNHTDQSCPKVPPSYWKTFNKILQAEFPEGGHFIVACAGGHGRTGTVLACIILAACPNMSVADVILFIRKTHCVEAIESATQIKYLLCFRPKEKPTDWMETEMAPVKSYGGGYNGSGGGYVGGKQTTFHTPSTLPSVGNRDFVGSVAYTHEGD